MSSQLKFANFAAIHHFQGENSRVDSFGDPLADLDYKEENRSYGASGGLVSALMDGWLTNQGSVTVQTVDDYASMYKETVESVLSRANAERLAIIQTWESKSETKALAITARNVWLPKGKPAKIDYIANNAYRRAWAIMGVLNRRETQSAGTTDYSYAIPVSVTKFESPLAALMEHSLENAKDMGRSRYSALDQLKVACMYFAQPGAKEVDLRRIMPTGTAQKVWALARLNFKFPEENLAERCFLPVNDEHHIPLASLDKDALRKLADGSPIDDVSGTKKGTVGVEGIQQYVVKVKTGGPAKQVAMPAKDIQTYVADNPIPLIAQIGKAIIGNDRAFFTTLNDRKDFATLKSLYAAIPVHVMDSVTAAATGTASNVDASKKTEKTVKA